LNEKTPIIGDTLYNYFKSLGLGCFNTHSEFLQFPFKNEMHIPTKHLG